MFSGISLKAFGNPYEVLGVSPQASDDEVIRAYRAKAKEMHPDVSKLATSEANRQFKQLQLAFETIQKLRRDPNTTQFRSQQFNRTRDSEKEATRKTAFTILEADWNKGVFNTETLRKLPMLAKKRANPGGFHFGRGPNEDGEWAAVSQFFKTYQTELLNRSPNPRDLKDLLAEIDIYTEFTGESVKDIKAGLLEPFENYIFFKTQERNLFLETLEDRLRRMSRTGSVSFFSPSQEASKKVFGPASEIYVDKFGPYPDSKLSPELQLAREISKLAFSKTEKNPTTLHELDYLIKSVPSALSAEEKLIFLADVMDQLDLLPKSRVSKGTLEDFRGRIRNKIKRIFDTRPELQKTFATRGRWWHKIMGSVSACDVLLGNLARSNRL